MSSDEVRAGQTLGRYELLTCVGRGGMASVWAARHRGAHGFSKIVAVKTMLPSVSDDADFQRMFLTEARVAARIRHPNVVETLDLGEEDGSLYIVMEWIDGETLSSIMKSAFLRGGVPLPIALKLMVDACAGAHAAHELCDDDGRPLGLVHRDVSPPNVLVSYSGVVKLADFGVAKTLELNNGATLAGQVKGKIRYMSPEQLLSAPIDRRTDVFALGVSLYQLTTGRHPWPGDTGAVTMRKILSENAAPPASFVESYPPELEHIVLKALARNPAERFQTAAEMALALEQFARSIGALATNRELAAYLTELLGSHGAARRNSLRTAIRDADLRDTMKELEPMFEEPAEPAAAPESEHVAEILSVHPWTRSTPLLAPSRGSALAKQALSFTLDRARAMPAGNGTKRAVAVAAAVVLFTAAYTVGGRRHVPPVTTGATEAAAAVAPMRDRANHPANDRSNEEHLSAPPIAPPLATSVQAPTADARTRHEIPHSVPPAAPRHPKVVAPPEHRASDESEPDVGF